MGLPKLLYLRSFLPPAATSLLLAFLLSSYFILVHPAPSVPAISSRLGWQSWEVVELPRKKVQVPINDNSTGGAGGEVEDDDGTLGGEVVLPLDSWDPLMPHSTGLTEIRAQACVWPPWLFESLCSPPTTAEQDARLGKWVRVDKDLNRKSGLWWLHLYYRRSRRFDVPYITAITVLGPKDEVPEGYFVSEGDDLHSGAWPKLPGLLLAYKLQSPPDPDALGAVEGLVDEEEVVTEVDVLYGEGAPWFGFTRVQPQILPKSSRHPESVGLVVRMGVPDLPPTPELRFHANGTFRIMQIADLHYSVGDGRCRDTDKSPCVADPDSATLVAEALDAEKPDLVVFTGDQLNGQDTSWDSPSVMTKFIQPVVERKIPFAVVFGNHDDQDDFSRAKLMSSISRMPYSLSRAGPSDVDGVGNYVLKILSGDASKIHLSSVYCLDSGAYAKKKYPWSGDAGYDWIKQSQIDWYLKTSASIPAIERPFHPDTSTDLGSIWSRHVLPSRLATRSSSRQNQEPTLKKPTGLMFFHIPLPEHDLEGDKDEDGNELDVGVQLDGNGSPTFNSGFFENGILQASDGVGGHEIKVIGNGHVHIAENCRRIKGVWMCFGGGGSYSGYGRVGFDRRFRIYDLSDYGEKITTFKRTEKGVEIDRMDLL